MRDTAAPLARGFPRPGMHGSQQSRPRRRTLVNCCSLPPAMTVKRNVLQIGKICEFLSRAPVIGGCGVPEQRGRRALGLQSWRRRTSPTCLCCASLRARGWGDRGCGCSLSMRAGPARGARRAVDASDGSASTACFASMWHPPLRRSGGVLRGNVTQRRRPKAGGCHVLPRAAGKQC